MDLGELLQNFDLKIKREDLRIFNFFFHGKSYLIYIFHNFFGSDESIFDPDGRPLLVYTVRVFRNKLEFTKTGSLTFSYLHIKASNNCGVICINAKRGRQQLRKKSVEFSIFHFL